MAPDRIEAILVHVEYIREKLDSQEERAREDRAAFRAHEKTDQDQFVKIWRKLNRLGGGLAFLVFLVSLVGAGTAIARLVLS